MKNFRVTFLGLFLCAVLSDCQSVRPSGASSKSRNVDQRIGQTVLRGQRCTEHGRIIGNFQVDYFPSANGQPTDARLRYGFGDSYAKNDWQDVKVTSLKKIMPDGFYRLEFSYVTKEASQQGEYTTIQLVTEVDLTGNSSPIYDKGGPSTFGFYQANLGIGSNGLSTCSGNAINYEVLDLNVVERW